MGFILRGGWLSLNATPPCSVCVYRSHGHSLAFVRISRSGTCLGLSQSRLSDCLTKAEHLRTLILNRKSVAWARSTPFRILRPAYRLEAAASRIDEATLEPSRSGCIRTCFEGLTPKTNVVTGDNRTTRRDRIRESRRVVNAEGLAPGLTGFCGGASPCMPKRGRV
jgi:hypothetical protein